MVNSYYVEGKSLSKKTTRSKHNDEVLLRALKHNMREITAEIGIRHDQKIDPSRTRSNIVLYCPGESATSAARVGNQIISKSVKKVRSNASFGIELIFSLGSGLDIGYRKFFQDCTDWATAYYQVPLLSSIIHFDESCPHCHVILIPLKDGKLSTSKILGNRQDTIRMQQHFYENVAKHFGLTQQKFDSETRAKTERKQDFLASIDASIADVVKPICGLSDDVLTALIKGDKVTLIRLLNISVPRGTMNRFLSLRSRNLKFI